MVQHSRRQFLADVGKGMVVASVGSSLAADLGFGAAFADGGNDRLNFGALESLVSLMQETPAARLLPLAVERLRTGTSIRDIAAAMALANARTFGGEDYVGFHTMMAIAPAVHMSGELPTSTRALPILKVMFRNAARIQERGGRTEEVLRPVAAAQMPAGQSPSEAVRESVRRSNVQEAEGRFAAASAGSAEDALNNLIATVGEGVDVHRVVLPYRCWDLLNIIGREQAHTLLRQSVRFCVRAETPRMQQYYQEPRAMLPRVLDQHRLEDRQLGNRIPDDAWIERLSETIFRGTPNQAADAVGAALAEGINPDSIGEAISLAVNQLVLRDGGRRQNEVQPNKPLGSVHGDSIGVHACDSANAWRNLARAGNARNKAICLILGGYQAARDRVDRGGDFLNWTPYPREDARRTVEEVGRDAVVPALNEAIRGRDQARACALVNRYVELGLPERPLWSLMLGYACSDDGALHAEKFYRTTTEEFTAARPAFRRRYLLALARVTASAYGYPAPGHDEARRLLGG
jgi:hypothetical protein